MAVLNLKTVSSVLTIFPRCIHVTLGHIIQCYFCGFRHLYIYHIDIVIGNILRERKY